MNSALGYLLCRGAVLAFCLSLSGAAVPEPAASPIRFGSLDAFIDPHGQPLAAYQFQLICDAGDVTLVGVEGGEPAAFFPPPFYDPRALTHKRIVIAAFNTGLELPRQNARVARLMVRIAGATPPHYLATLQAAATPDARPLQATLTIREGDQP